MIAVAERLVARVVPAAAVEDEARAFARARLLCLGAILVFALIFFAAQVRLYQAGTTHIEDLANYVQPLHGLINGGRWEVSIEYNSIGLLHTRSAFAGHLYPLLFAFVPFYALVPHVYTLFALQALVPPLAAYLVLLIAQARLKNSQLALALSLAYLLYLPLQWTVLNGIYYGFHIENFFPPLFLLGHYLLWHRKRAMAALLAFALSLTVVETFAVMVACYALYLIVWGGWRRVGVALFALSVGYYAAAQLLILPHFSQGSGAAYLSLLQTINVSSPTTQHYLALIPIAAAKYMIVLFVPLLGLPLLDWRLLAVAAPTVGINFLGLLSGYQTPASPRSYHVNAIVPLCFLAAIGGLEWLIAHPQAGRQIARGMALALVPAGLVLAAWLGPLQGIFLRPSRYIVDYRAPALAAIAPLIPPDASLSADSFLGGRFTQRAQLHIFPAAWEASDYVLFDVFTVPSQEGYYGVSTDVYQKILVQIEQDPTFRLLYQQGSVYLFARQGQLHQAAAGDYSTGFRR